MTISQKLALKFIGILALLLCLIWAGNTAVAYFAPAHPDVLATMIGAAATIFAGWLAWESVTFQSRHAEQAKADRARIRKEDAVIAVARAVEAASVLCKSLSLEIWRDARGDLGRIKKSANHLDQVFGRELLQGLMDELETEDRVDLLMIIFQLHRVLAMSEYKTNEVLSLDNLKDMRTALDDFADILVRFDGRLHTAFVNFAGRRDQPDRVRAVIGD